MKAWSRLSIGSRLLLTFSAMAAIVFLTGAVGYVSSARIHAGLSEVFVVRFPAVTLLLESDRDLHQLLVAERSLLFADPASAEYTGHLKDYDDNLRQASERWNKYKALPLSDAERALVAKFEAARSRWMSASRLVIEARQAGQGDTAQALSLGDAKRAFDEMREFINQGQELNDSAIAATEASTSAVYRQMRLWLAVSCAGGAFSALFLAWWVSSGVVRQVARLTAAFRQGSDQVIGASGQVATAAQSLSQGATKQAAALEQTSASLAQLADVTRRNAASSDQASSLAGEVNALVASSNEQLAALVTSMRGIDDSSAQVARIIKTIDEIAFQTNLLALNAAVEAARAAEAGMGFAVVADEVRALAQRAAQAARDTSGLIDLARASTREGSTKVDGVVASFTALTAAAARVHQIANEVSNGSRDQTRGIDEITKALRDIEDVTRTSAATAEESAAASEELNAQAEAAGALVVDLERLVSRAREATVSSPRETVALRSQHRRAA